MTEIINLDSSIITALATGLLVVVGIAQVAILIVQKKQTRLELASEYRRRWFESKEHLGKIVFIGREPEEYYQVVEKEQIFKLKELVNNSNLSSPTVWAKDSTQNISGILSEVCLRILQGQLKVSDAYPIFGTELLRHSRPLRKLLDTEFVDPLFFKPEFEKHWSIRREIQDWFIYHDGIRRRCLILIDLLWAEAVRLEDLPPSDIFSAAEAKNKKGVVNRKRIIKETRRLNGFSGILLSWQLSYFLRHSEYKSFYNRVGIKKKRLNKLQSDWNKRILRGI